MFVVWNNFAKNIYYQINQKLNLIKKLVGKLNLIRKQFEIIQSRLL